ncbi:class I SAM-dependent DNA methyltransferase [Mesobacillus jeotgali]|uniref:class I SAM-dependent DNA methyltransferase n=1 Tax=Mesobacillus jeotgali TaxID=129985 RepID=UPI00177EF6BA|nr:class I SAM-dependent methyltransferase [Mesobacillus jeotgali]UYZ23787.1 class I SAM-dependent methyltransferase [Mesobacillus jeotgali]
MGREFIPLFDDWAEFYEDTVSGNDLEYKEVFENYDKILQTVALRSNGTVLEFGVGTGNLTEKLISLGRVVYGVEPSKAMRAKTKARFTDLHLYDGDFINFPDLPGKVDSIVSTYAFHHLSNEEKDTALKLYSKLLGDQGKIVFADTAFVNEEHREERHRIVKEQGHENLLADLKREYYTTLEILERLFEKNGFQVSFEKMNSYVWLMEAVKVSKN